MLRNSVPKVLAFKQAKHNSVHLKPNRKGLLKLRKKIYSFNDSPNPKRSTDDFVSYLFLGYCFSQKNPAFPQNERNKTTPIYTSK